MLAANRIDRSRITEVEVDSGPQTLLDRKVDALLDYEELAPAELQSQGKRIAVMRLADFGVRIYSLNLIVNEMAYLTRLASRPRGRSRTPSRKATSSCATSRPRRRRSSQALPRFFAALPRARHADRGAPALTADRQPDPGRLGGHAQDLSGQRLLDRAVSAEEVAIYD